MSNSPHHVLYEQLVALLNDESYPISNMANMSAFLWEHCEAINWVGFYLVYHNVLKVGPFQGRVACSTIDFGKGVCGTAWKEQKTIVVPDVHEFPGHIACDSASQSEVVIPLIAEGAVFALLDIDAPIKNRFTDADVNFFQKCAQLIQKST